MKPHFGQSDAAMNKLAGCNSFPNAGKTFDLTELEQKAREAGFNTPFEYLRAQHESAAGMGLEPEFIERLMAKECQHEFTDIATCVHCGCDTDGFISSKRIEPKGQGGLVAEFTLRREPMTKGYFGHENGCDCAVCEDMHNTELRRKIVDAEWNKLMDDNSMLVQQVAEITERMGRDIQFWKDETRRAIEAGDSSYVKAMKLYGSTVELVEKYRAALHIIAHMGISGLSWQHDYEKCVNIAKEALEI